MEGYFIKPGSGECKTIPRVNKTCGIFLQNTAHSSVTTRLSNDVNKQSIKHCNSLLNTVRSIKLRVQKSSNHSL